MRLRALLPATLLLAATAAAQPFDTPDTPNTPETPATVATMPAMSRHWVFVPDRLFEHSLIYDGDTGEALGTIDTGTTLTPKPPLVARSRGEIYSADIAYTRGKRGDRMDFVTIYDTKTLDVKGDIPLTRMAAESNQSLAYFEMLDGDRFLLVFNQFPEISVSVVDVERRQVSDVVPTAGCAGIFPVAPLRFGMLCGDGTALLVTLDENGKHVSYASSERFFDPVVDPVALSAGRRGTSWLFVSYEGEVHEVDFSGDTPEHRRQWSLVDERERAQHWRPGGLQYVAVHQKSGRLYVVMHQGGEGTHKDAGPEIWVYDIDRRERVATFEVPNLTAAFIGPLLDVEPESMLGWLLDWVLPSEGAQTIVVSQDDEPLLFARNGRLGAVAVLDARSGEHLRTLTEAGIAGPTMAVP